MAGHLHFFAPLHSSAFQTVEHSSCLLTCFYHTYSLALISLLPPTLQGSPHGVNHTLLAAHLRLPRLWVWCCLAQLLGYPLLFLSIYSLWALPPGSLDVDVLLLTKKKGKRNQTCTVFTKGNTYFQYFDCIDLALECGDLFEVHTVYDGTEIALYSMLASRCALLKPWKVLSCTGSCTRGNVYSSTPIL